MMICSRSACEREHAVTIDLRVVPGVGAEIVLRVDGELRRPRLYRAHEQAELSGAIADTRAAFEGRGGRDADDEEQAAPEQRAPQDVWVRPAAVGKVFASMALQLQVARRALPLQPGTRDPPQPRRSR
jgi:hypothetical protein